MKRFRAREREKKEIKTHSHTTIAKTWLIGKSIKAPFSLRAYKLHHLRNMTYDIFNIKVAWCLRN